MNERVVLWTVVDSGIPGRASIKLQTELTCTIMQTVQELTDVLNGTQRERIDQDLFRHWGCGLVMVDHKHGFIWEEEEGTSERASKGRR